ncbi:MAG: dienelactone hydrolase family protein [Chloroflexota bacterium]|nr:dienelactone hydrolase family protein [Chloroflexota bacterium]
MCYDNEAQPPVPPGAIGSAHSEEVVLTAADGNRFAAYVAYPDQPSGSTAQIIIYPDVRGLFQFYKDLALRFAEVGVTALALDYFGRTAGLGERDEALDFWPHVQQLSLESFTLDVKAAQTYLQEKGGKDSAIFVVGFCMGGSFALLTGTNPDFGFAGLIAFYAGMSRNFGGNGTVLDHAEKVVYPVLGLFGGADQGIPQSDVQQLDEKLDVAGVPHTIVVYPGATHSFFDRRATEFAEASADAWQRVLDFIR